MPVTCLVVGCGSRSNRDKVGFYSVPTVLNHKFVTDSNELSKKRRTLWLGAISRNDLTDAKIKNQRVCSKHFTTGKPASLYDENHPDWVPTQDMGHVLKQPDGVEKKDKVGKRRTLQVSKEPGFIVADQESFVRALLAIFKEHPVLWDKNHPHYRNRSERMEAQEILLLKCKEFYPEADGDFVKLRLESLRGCFRKEWNKVCKSKALAKCSDDIYKPTLWYYNLLLFTVGEDDEVNSDDARRVPLWNKEYLIILINAFKKHPCLHGNESATASLGKRNAAYDKLTKEINDISGKLFTVEDVKKKIMMLKNQYRFELRKIKRAVPANTKSNLWYFEMLDFLGKNKCAKSSSPDEETLDNQRSNRVIVETTSHLETDNWQHIKEETDTEHDEEYGKANLSEITERNIMDYDDIYDTIGKNVAHKLREMSDDQRIFAERLINEIVYHGMMGNLNENSRLCLREIE